MSVDIVRSVKNSLVDQGANLNGPDGAFEITKRVAALTNLGVLSKTTGNNAHGYAADIVMDHTGRIWDILIDGGGANEPSWNEGEPVDPARYRVSPWDGLPAAPPTTSPAAPPPVDTRFDTILALLRDIEVQLNDLHTTVAIKQAPPAYQGSLWGIKVVLRPV